MMKNENDEMQELEIEQMLIPEYSGVLVPKYFKKRREYFELDSQIAIIKNIRNTLNGTIDIIQEGYGRADIRDDDIIKDKEAYLYVSGGPFLTRCLTPNNGVINCECSLQVTFMRAKGYKRPQDGMAFGYFIHTRDNLFSLSHYAQVFYGHSPLYAYLSLASRYLDMKIF